MRSFRLILTLVLLVFAACARAAYHYGFDIGNSGFVLTDPKTAGWSSTVGDYDAPTGGTQSSDTYSGPYSYASFPGDVYGPGTYISGSCSGTIQYKFKWATTNPGPPPAQVVLRVSCQAVSIGNDPPVGGSDGSADDGLGDPAVSFAPGQKPHHELDDYFWAYRNAHSYGVESAGVHCVVVDVQPDGTFEYNITPAASRSDTQTATCVALFVTVCDPILDVAGTRNDQGALSCLVGQQQIASVSINGLSPRVTAWSVPGAGVFGRVDASQPQTNSNVPSQPNGNPSTYVEQHQYIPTIQKFAVGNSSQALFYNVQATGPETISCTVDIYDINGSTKLDTVMLSRTVQVIAPTFTFTQSPGTKPNAFVDQDVVENTIFLRFYSSNGWYSTYDITTPSSFVTGTDTGKVALCQLIKEDRVHTPDTDGQGHTGTTDGTGYWLDNAFPYPESLYPALEQGKTRTTPIPSLPDEPTDLLNNPAWTKVSINNSYLTSLIYLAPGSGSEYVPLSTLGWTWISYAEYQTIFVHTPTDSPRRMCGHPEVASQQTPVLTECTTCHP